jgi:hypothetical protein
VVKEKKKIWFIAGMLLFLIYFFAAARPIPVETILSARWLHSLESDYPVLIGETPDTETGDLLLFTLGDRFGYVDRQGNFSVNRARKGYISLSETLWAEYEAEPELIEIKNNIDESLGTIKNGGGYPLFLDQRIFLVGNEQNSLSETDREGNILWTYEFAAPLTCIDAAAGLVLTGSLDGVVEVLDSDGRRIFVFEPGGSRFSVIPGCAISRDGTRLGIVSGIDDQRFLLLEQFGNTSGEYKVVYHEFLEDGFRRAVHISFINQDRWIVFEREGGLGIYEIDSRMGEKIVLEDEIAAIDSAGGQELFLDRKSVV